MVLSRLSHGLQVRNLALKVFTQEILYSHIIHSHLHIHNSPVYDNMNAYLTVYLHSPKPFNASKAAPTSSRIAAKACAGLRPSASCPSKMKTPRRPRLLEASRALALEDHLRRYREERRQGALHLKDLHAFSQTNCSYNTLYI